MEKALKKSANDVMTKKVMSVKPSETIKNLFQLMDKHGILGVPVIDEKKHVVGMITETDLIEHFTTLETPRSINLLGGILFLDNTEEFNKNLKDHCAETVKDLMTSPVITVKESARLLDMINLMSTHKITRLPVVNGKKELVGIVTRTDVVHELAKIENL
jgi:CBS domain-containing protein